MGRQPQLMAVSERVGSPDYRFYLQNATGGLLEIDAPDGWKDAKYSITRDMVYWGVTSVISFNDLNFLKAARDYIRDVYEGQGINALITFTVTRIDGATGGYISYFTGKLDLATYKIDQTGVRCQVIDTSFAEKIRNRQNQKVNLRERTSIEGYEIPAFSDEDMRVSMPNYEIVAQAAWYRYGTNTSTVLDNHYVPLWLGVSEFTEAQSQNPDIPIADDGGMYINSLADRAVHISGHISGRCEFTSVLPHVTFTIKIYVAGVAVHTILSVSGTAVSQLTFSADFVDDIAPLTGQDFWIQGTLDHSGTTYYDTDINVSMSSVLSSVTGTAPISYPYYEAFLRNLQIITDSNDCFKSTKFGRTDSEVTTYASDGQLGHITRGVFIRGAEGLTNSLSLALSETFKSLSSLFCLGAGIENIGGVNKFVVETLSYFFDSNVVLDLSASIVEETIGKEVIPDKHFAGIMVGYNSFEYLTQGGLAEFNTKMEFTTVISAVDTKLDLIGKYRADTQGIILLMKNTASTSDIKGDDDIFLIDSIRQVGPLTGFKARTDEDFILVTGGADAENSFNLDYTPKRNLLRNGLKIRAGLEKNLGTYVRWQAGDKNTSLQTQRTAETVPLVENADVLVNDLTEPFFLPEFYNTECVMYTTELETIKTNPKGLIKIAPLKYGWIWDLKMGSEENKVTLKLLRANLNVITPIE